MREGTAVGELFLTVSSKCPTQMGTFSESSLFCNFKATIIDKDYKIDPFEKINPSKLLNRWLSVIDYLLLENIVKTKLCQAQDSFSSDYVLI